MPDTTADLGAEVARLKAATSLPAIVGQDIPLKREGPHFTGCCPFHNEKTPSFTVYPDHFHCFGCGVHGDVFDWLKQHRRMELQAAVVHLGGDAARGPALPAPTDAPAPAPEQSDTRPLARQIWREAVPAAGTLVERYLESRGLKLPARAPIRFHPQCPRRDERLPAMVSLMTDPESGEPCGVHRTFLRADGGGKAEGKAKMMAGNGGVVRLVPDEDVTRGLGLAEGIETSLGIMQLAAWSPVWAGTSTSGIRTFPVLGGIEVLTIFPDRDDKPDKKGVYPGMGAAEACSERWLAAARHVEIWSPPLGSDWLDVLLPKRAA